MSITPEVEAEETPAQVGPRDRIQHVVNQLAALFDKAGEFAGITSGDAAALRRMREGEVEPAAFWRLAVTVLEPEGLVSSLEAERAWRTIIGLMARAASLHKPSIKLGAALEIAGCSEARVTRMLDAKGQSLEPALRGLVHQLASQSVKFNHAELARLVLTEFVPGLRRDWAETRRRVARAYFASTPSKSDTPADPA
ncbi:MAG: type I-E CRISPR-associated protein Cse2/CasB [Deltaproteobacteria bacterium]|nr:type I-E CRISPR-associated protein Cse2/CasB [Deltaproteobacteria bacterium]